MSQHSIFVKPIHPWVLIWSLKAPWSLCTLCWHSHKPETVSVIPTCTSLVNLCKKSLKGSLWPFLTIGYDSAPFPSSWTLFQAFKAAAVHICCGHYRELDPEYQSKVLYLEFDLGRSQFLSLFSCCSKILASFLRKHLQYNCGPHSRTANINWAQSWGMALLLKAHILTISLT